MRHSNRSHFSLRLLPSPGLLLLLLPLCALLLLESARGQDWMQPEEDRRRIHQPGPAEDPLGDKRRRTTKERALERAAAGYSLECTWDHWLGDQLRRWRTSYDVGGDS